MRLGDLDALHDHVMEEMRRNPHCGHVERMMHRHEHESFLRDIRLAPTVDAIPVVHGRWVMKETMIRSPFAKNAYCSECLEETGYTTNYCPNCGAKMEADGDV